MYQFSDIITYLLCNMGTVCMRGKGSYSNQTILDLFHGWLDELGLMFLILNSQVLCIFASLMVKRFIINY